MRRFKLLIVMLVALMPAGPCRAQDVPSDTVAVLPPSALDSVGVVTVVSITDSLPDSLQLYRDLRMRDSIRIERLSLRLDSSMSIQLTLRQRMRDLIMLKDSLVAANDLYQKELQEKNTLMGSQVKALQEKEKLLAEKEELYRKALSASDVDKAKWEGELKSKETSIEAKSREISYLQKDIDAKEVTLKSQREIYTHLLDEKEHYRHLVDSLQKRVNAVEIENIRKQEENKYLQQRAKDAEEKAAITLNKKKKVRPIQGIALRFFRTPQWDIRLTPETVEGTTVSYSKVIRNRNAGDIEFDFVTGASVMLWDLTKFFDASSRSDTLGGLHELPRFDQKFNYDLGIYVGFGGSNLFKNFYIGPSFRFVDFFYLTVGVNICEYEMLIDGYKAGQSLEPVLTLDDITAKSWLVKPFVSLSIDLDFLSYIKK